MKKTNKAELINKLELVVEAQKKELKTAIDEGADNAIELMKGVAVLAGVVLIIYLIFQAKSNKKSSKRLKNRLSSRMEPLVSMALQKGASLFMEEATNKLVDYLNAKKDKEETAKNHVSSE